MRCTYILPTLLLFSTVVAGHAAGLTADDCEVLAAVYGVTPAECHPISAVSAPEAAPPVEVMALPAPPAEAVAATVPPSVEALRVDYVFFMQGGSALDPVATVQLDALARMLEVPPMHLACLKLVGHADAVGDSGVNQRLSRDRAEAVAAYLRTRLALPQRVVDVQGAGSANLLPGFVATAPEHRRVSLMVRECTATDLTPG